jgi:hypothetical protein
MIPNGAHGTRAELKEEQSQFGFAPVVQTSTCSAMASIIDFDAKVPDGALDLCMSQRVGFVLRISFLIENQGPVAHRSVLAVATGCAGR